MAASKTLSLHGKAQKFDSRADIEPYLKDVDPTVIEEIRLGGNTIGVEASYALAEFLTRTTVLKIADFADIFTGRLISEIPLALTAICDALKDKTTLVEINLSDNAFGGRSVDPMVPFLTHNRSLQVLKLSNNGLGPAGGEVLANALAESARLSKAAGKESNLRSVICGRNRLEDGSASAWADAFAAHGTLVEVRMPQNGIRMDGIIALAGGLAKCSRLQHLDLQDNTFTADGDDTGVRAWAGALKNWPKLSTLNLSDCVLAGDEDGPGAGEVPAIVTTLVTGSNPELKVLRLQNNNLTSNVSAVLAAGISKLAKLKTLELQWNDVEADEELENLAEVLKKRGGRHPLDEEEEEEEEEEKEEKEDEGEAQDERGIKADEKEIDTKGREAEPVPVDTSADDLADLLGQVKIN